MDNILEVRNTYSDNIFAVPNNYSQSLDKLLLQELGQIVV